MFLTNIRAHLWHRNFHSQEETKPRETSRTRTALPRRAPRLMELQRRSLTGEMPQQLPPRGPPWTLAWGQRAPPTQLSARCRQAAARPSLHRPAHRLRAFRLLAALRSCGGGYLGRSPAQTASAANRSPQLHLNPAWPPGLTRPPRPAGARLGPAEASALRPRPTHGGPPSTCRKSS